MIINLGQTSLNIDMFVMKGKGSLFRGHCYLGSKSKQCISNMRSLIPVAPSIVIITNSLVKDSLSLLENIIEQALIVFHQKY